jgi:hypothetical protein
MSRRSQRRPDLETAGARRTVAGKIEDTFFVRFVTLREWNSVLITRQSAGQAATGTDAHRYAL